MTAVPGCGALAPAPVECEPPPPLDEPPDDDADGEDEDEGEDDDDEVEEELGPSSLSCCEKGSLLAKRLNEESGPSATAGADDDASDAPDGSAGGVSLPPRVGAARLGV